MGLWSPKRIQGYQESLASHFTPAMALLRIPKIHLEVPVLEGTDDLSLNRAVGQIAESARPGETSDGNGKRNVSSFFSNRHYGLRLLVPKANKERTQ